VYSVGNAFHEGAIDTCYGWISELLFTDKTFTIRHRNMKFAKVFSCKINPLYGSFIPRLCYAQMINHEKGEEPGHVKNVAGREIVITCG